MPIFDYQCKEKKCNYIFEVFIPPCGSENKIIKCPMCNSMLVDKLFSTPNIQFKGSGFYETDYKKNKKF